MTTSEWISRKVAQLLPSSGKEKQRLNNIAEALKPTPAPEISIHEKPARQRTIKERLASTLRNKDEALSPRLLRRTWAQSAKANRLVRHSHTRPKTRFLAPDERAVHGQSRDHEARPS